MNTTKIITTQNQINEFVKIVLRISNDIDQFNANEFAQIENEIKTYMTQHKYALYFDRMTCEFVFACENDCEFYFTCENERERELIYKFDHEWILNDAHFMLNDLMRFRKTYFESCEFAMIGSNFNSMINQLCLMID